MSILRTSSELRDSIFHADKQIILASYWVPHNGPGMSGYNGAGRAAFNSEHIPTSMFCDPSAALAAVPSSGTGRNPLPNLDSLARWFTRWGLRSDRGVVVYDHGKGLFAARAWWVLTWAGVADVSILDGGLAAWDKQGYPVLAGPGNLQSDSDVTPRIGQLPLATMEDVKNFGGQLIDAREPNRFHGHKELFDLKAGHIPGAINVPSRDLLNPDNTYKSPAEIRARFAEEGITGEAEMIVYSGSGNHSSQALAAMHMAGLTGAAHYVGGWSQWSADPANPIAHPVSQRL
ncbi:sulfurtransferase [Corynebacterium sp. A21]|uniref:sulfurtransferase n=1 Tax=Corynebacterium sp. A21 TaxID=3457318 RepID=UPI003FD41B7F